VIHPSCSNRLGVCTDRWGDPRHDFIDCDWNPVDYGLTTQARCEPPLQRPRDLGQLLDIAGQLSAVFRFVRFDLYRYRDQIVFGEMTLSPSAGDMPIQQPGADLLWGSWLKLPRRH
jgi:hypothetical protein